MLNHKNDTLAEPFCFTSDAVAEFQAIFRLYYRLLIEGTCCLEIEPTLRRRMTQLIDKLIEEGKILAAAFMRHDRDLIACYQRRHPSLKCPSLKCPIPRFMDELLHALVFRSKTFDKKSPPYIS